MLVNVLLTVVSTVAYAFPLGVGCFLAARLLWGACYSHLRLGGYLVALGASPAGLGLALGLIQSFSRLGSMLAVLGGGLLADRWGYSWVMAGAGLFSLGALPFVGGCRGALGKAEIGSVDPLPRGVLPHQRTGCLCRFGTRLGLPPVLWAGAWCSPACLPFCIRG